MQNLKVFNFDKFQVRTMIEDDKVFFVARDVAEALGYKKTENAVLRYCKDTLKRGTLTAGGIQQLTVIEEPDVYALIFGSKLESAQKFKRWVFEEVLPSIRKQGFYADLNNNLTALSREQVLHNLDKLYLDLKRALPSDCRITSECNLLDDGKGKTNLSGETRAQTAYLREMDDRKLPGIVVIETTPIMVVFDWLRYDTVDQQMRKELYDDLAKLCEKYKSNISNSEPFKRTGSLEEIYKFASAQDAHHLATEMRLAVARKLN